MRKWIFKDTDFNKFPVYNGDDLGVIRSEDSLSVRIWAPAALEVLFRLYSSVDAESAEKAFEMIRSESGTWTTELDGNYEQYFYTFQVRDEKGG